MATDLLPAGLVAAGIVLLVMEALAPGAYLIVLGIALLGAGAVGLVLSTSGLLTGGALVGALAGLTFLFGLGALYVYREFEFYRGVDAGSTTDVGSLQGQRGKATEQITEDAGEVKLEDGGFAPTYEARSLDEPIPAGEEVLVVDPGGGNVLTVAPFDQDEIERELADGERAVKEPTAESTGGDAGEPETAPPVDELEHEAETE